MSENNSKDCPTCGTAMQWKFLEIPRCPKCDSGFNLLHDARQLRNGPIKRMDIRKVEGKNLFIDLIERKPVNPLFIFAQLGFRSQAEMENFYNGNPKYYQCTNLAANNVLWGEKWPSNDA